MATHFSDLNEHPDWPRWKELLQKEALLRGGPRKARMASIEKCLEEDLEREDEEKLHAGLDESQVAELLQLGETAAEDGPEVHPAPMGICAPAPEGAQAEAIFVDFFCSF